MRLFIAFDVSSEAKEYLNALQEKLPSGKLTKTKSFHLTLKFIGEVSPQKAEQVMQKLGEINFPMFKANLSEIGLFPNKENPRVIWVGVEPKEVIVALQKKIEVVLSGLFEEEKDFVPHLTLARVQEQNKTFVQDLSKLKIVEHEFKVTQFELIESTLTKKGPIHKILKNYILS